MSHNFLPSIKKGINYCTNCGCLSYNNNPSQNIGCITNNLNIMKIDPLTIRYKPISLKIDFSLLSHKAYITYRQKGLSKINYLTSNYNLSNMIKYKSIGLMDQIYLNNKDIYIESIEIIATICILLCIEFNDCCSISEKNGLYSRNYNNNLQRKLNIKNDSYEINNKKSLYQHIKKEIKDIMYWQSFCLEKLDYNLGKYSAYDYLNLFFELGIVFNKENSDIINKYEFCLNFLEIIIKNYNICKYNQYVIALSIIYINFNNNKYFKEKIFKYIYGVDFSKKKYQLCALRPDDAADERTIACVLSQENIKVGTSISHVLSRRGLRQTLPKRTSSTCSRTTLISRMPPPWISSQAQAASHWNCCREAAVTSSA